MGVTSPLLVGIEAGGTKFVCRIVDQAGRTVHQSRFGTTTPLEVVETLVGVIKTVAAGGAVQGLGIASFGPVIVDPSSADLGLMLATPPKAGWSGFNLVRALAGQVAAPIRIDTDVNAAALAEQAIGAARGLHTVAYVTVGTGLGGGLAINGQTLKGGLHPEIGHMNLRRAEGDEQPSVCGLHPGCAEGLVSGPAVGQRLAGRSLAEAPEVRALVVDYLGQVCANLLLTWSPQRIVLGGGVMATPGLVPEIEARMRRELNGYGAGVVAEAPGYLASAALEHAGLEGALILARQAAEAA